MKLCKDCRHFWREGIAGFYCLSPHIPNDGIVGIKISPCEDERSDIWRYDNPENKFCGPSADFFDPREE